MNAIRRVPLPIHAALRMATGLLTMCVPFLAGFAVPATLVSIVIGSIVVGVSLIETPDERGLTALAPETLHALDWASVLLLLAGAFGVALAGDSRSGLALVAIAAAQTAGNLTTHYSLRRPELRA